jgi:hypothetical protein
MLARLTESAEARVVGDQRQPASPLIVVPADPSIPAFQVVRSRRPTQQSQPASAVFGDVSQLLAHHPRALQ